MYAPVNPYISLTEIIEELKLTAAEVAADPDLTDELQRAIERASRWVDNYTRRDSIFRDFSVNPMIFDQYSKSVYGFEIFFPNKPILSINKVLLGSAPTCAKELIFNVDYFNDADRIYLLRSSTLFIQNPDIPRDGSSGLFVGPNRGGWCLSRPDRMLFVYGQSGCVQARAFQMTAAGGGAVQTDAWTINSYTTPTTLYWSVKLIDEAMTVTVTSDSFGAQVVCQGSTTASGPQVITLAEVNDSGIDGQMSLNYASDSAGNSLTVTPNTTAPIVPFSIPQNTDPIITTATRLVAASFSGHNRKETVGLDGQKTDIADRSIPKTVYDLLGRKMPLLV